jgi:cbb3-type cytochrome oxidase cytochrome c subunit
VKSSSTIFLAAFAAASLSWTGFVLAPQLQLGNLTQAKPANSDNLYPSARPGLAAQGAEVYRSLGCVYCHSQQVRQEGAHCDVVLNEIGTNRTEVEAIVAELNHPMRRYAGVQVGKIAEVADVPAGEPLAARLKKAGAKVDLRVVQTGVDISRGWGIRQTVAQDYLFDSPVQLGSRRNGPDLSNVGAGKPIEWQLLHLYQPDFVVTNSTMPPYPFLFEKREISGVSSPDALKLPQELVKPPRGAKPGASYEVVPTEAARALVAYLHSLRADAPLKETPVTVAQVATATATNSPVK